MITRRNLIATGALGAASVGLAACGNSGGSSTDPTDKKANGDKTVTLWIMEGTNAKSDEYVKALQEEFKNKTGATLKVEVQPWDGAHDKFVTAMAGGTGPDVAEVGTTWTPEFADAGGLDDLERPRDAAAIARLQPFGRHRVAPCKLGMQRLDAMLLQPRAHALAHRGRDRRHRRQAARQRLEIEEIGRASCRERV